MTMSPEEFGQYMVADIAKWAHIKISGAGGSVNTSRTTRGPTMELQKAQGGARLGESTGRRFQSRRRHREGSFGAVER
jgi:hypothetical protein